MNQIKVLCAFIFTAFAMQPWVCALPAPLTAPHHVLGLYSAGFLSVCEFSFTKTIDHLPPVSSGSPALSSSNSILTP